MLSIKKLIILFATFIISCSLYTMELEGITKLENARQISYTKDTITAAYDKIDEIYHGRQVVEYQLPDGSYGLRRQTLSEEEAEDYFNQFKTEWKQQKRLEREIAYFERMQPLLEKERRKQLELEKRYQEEKQQQVEGE